MYKRGAVGLHEIKKNFIRLLNRFHKAAIFTETQEK